MAIRTPPALRKRIADLGESLDAHRKARQAAPKKMSEQIAAARDALSGTAGLWTASQVASGFTGAKPGDVTPVLESLATLGLLLALDGQDGPPLEGALNLCLRAAGSADPAMPPCRAH